MDDAVHLEFVPKTFSYCDHKQDWQPYPVDPYPCYIVCVTRHAVGK